MNFIPLGVLLVSTLPVIVGSVLNLIFIRSPLLPALQFGAIIHWAVSAMLRVAGPR